MRAPVGLLLLPFVEATLAAGRLVGRTHAL